MIAAVYARKSTAQAGEAEDRSVARQIANARTFAASKGWHVPDEHVYVDDGISGAETTRLVSKQRMLAIIKAGHVPFQALVMQGQDRLSRRDGDEAVGELKAIARAGVAVWFYSDGQPFAHGTFQANTLAFLKAEFNAEFRRDIAKKTRESLARRASQGYITGGSTFGYANVRMNSHVVRRVLETEADVVRRIYALYAAGQGLTSIAKQLNIEGAICPRPQRGRPAGWAPSTIREILRRDLYRGVQTFGRTKKRNDEWIVQPRTQPSANWLRVPVPELRIVPEALAEAVDARLQAMHARMLRTADGRLLGRPPGEGARYLLTGLMQCGVCGGGFEALSRKHGSRRARVYGCATHRRKGAVICPNGLVVPMEDADLAVLAALEDTVLAPAVVTRALDVALDTLATTRSGAGREAIDTELQTLDQAIARLTQAIIAGGELPPLVQAVQTYETRRQELRAAVATITAPAAPVDAAAVRRDLAGYLRDWRGLLRANLAQGQQVLRRLITGRLTFTPRESEYDFHGRGTVRPVLGALVQKLASLTAPTWNRLLDWVREVQTLRQTLKWAA